MKFIFRLDFGPKIGWGHLSRCLGMASALLARGYEVAIATQSRPEGHVGLTKLLEGKMLEVHTVVARDPHVSQDTTPLMRLDQQVSDAVETLRIASLTKADIVVLDHYGLDSTWIETVRKSFPVCLISDRPAQSEVDYILDYGFDATRQKHAKGLGSSTQVMLGTAFAPVSENYSRFAELPRDEGTRSNLVLVSLGGFAEETLARRVVGAVNRAMPAAEIHFAGNSLTYSSLSLDSQFENVTAAVEPSLIRMFESARLAIVGAGVTMYELVSSGALGLVIQTADNQENSFSAALEKGYLSGAQQFSDVAFEQLIAQRLAHKTRTAIPEWLKARSLVDHLGSKRFALKFGGYSSFQPKLRPVEISDLPFLLRLANQATSLASSLNSKVIEPTEHWEWSKGFIDGSKLGWVYGTDELQLGHCRLERKGSKLYLSYSIQEEFHGEGFGSRMLRALFEGPSTAEQIFAKVKPSNAASVRALKSVGFVPISSNEELITMVREP